MPYEGFIRKHAGSNTTDLIIYLQTRFLESSVF